MSKLRFFDYLQVETFNFNAYKNENNSNKTQSGHRCLYLFDTYVVSVMNYSCAIWGVLKAENIERIHRTVCERVLGVKSSTNSIALYSVLGTFH